MKAAIAMAILFALTASAQWAKFPTPGVPRGPDGKPNLSAPAPKTADGKPDLSGIWVNYRFPRTQQPQAAAVKPAGAETANAAFFAEPSDPAPLAPPGLAAAGPPLATFADVGRNIPGGAPLKPIAAALVKARIEEHSKDNPDAHCLPLGLMQLHLHPQPRKIIQTPAVTAILYEAQGGVRQIFTDGRPLPPSDAQPWWYGYSVGKWEGDTLVVETTGFRDDVWLDINGTPLTNTGKMTERFRRLNYGSLEIIVTIEDPEVYTKPYTVRVAQRLMADTELIEFICQENDHAGPHLVGK